MRGNQRDCIFKNCGSSQTSSSDLTFFAFPRLKARRFEWFERSGNEELLNETKASMGYVCELHFDKSDITFIRSSKKLKPTAVPNFWYQTRSLSEPVDDTDMMEIEDLDEENQSFYDSDDKAKAPQRSLETKKKSLPPLILNSLIADKKPVILPDLDSLTFITVDPKESPVGSPKKLETQETQTEEHEKNSQPQGTQTTPGKSTQLPKLDEDDYFAVSVVSTILKRLQTRQKAEAKIGILSLLHKLEQDGS